MYRSLCIVLVLLAVSMSIFTVARAIDVMKFVNACKETNYISEELLNQLLSNYSLSEMDDPEGQCFAACMFKQAGLLKSDGTVDTAVPLTDMEPRTEDVDIVTVAIGKCAALSGEGCEKQYRSVRCIERVEELIKFWKYG